MSYLQYSPRDLAEMEPFARAIDEIFTTFHDVTVNQ
jgi:hypothetical protein